VHIVDTILGFSQSLKENDGQPFSPERQFNIDSEMLKTILNSGVFDK
jgi:hypothetical protein